MCMSTKLESKEKCEIHRPCSVCVCVRCCYSQRDMAVCSLLCDTSFPMVAMILTSPGLFYNDHTHDGGRVGLEKGRDSFKIHWKMEEDSLPWCL